MKVHALEFAESVSPLSGRNCCGLTWSDSGQRVEALPPINQARPRPLGSLASAYLLRARLELPREFRIDA